MECPGQIDADSITWICFLVFTFVNVFTSIWFRSITLEARRALTVISSVCVSAIAVTWIDVWIIAFVDIIAAMGDVWIALETTTAPAVMPLINRITILRTLIKICGVVKTEAVITAAGR